MTKHSAGRVHRVVPQHNTHPEKRPAVSLDRADWERPTTDRHETAPRSRSYMVGERWVQETPEVDLSPVIAAFRAEHRRVTA